MRHASLLAIVPLSVLGCNLYLPVEVVEPLCPAGTQVTVGPGTQPEISWDGDCRARVVRVDSLPLPPNGVPGVAWRLYSSEGMIRSPVRVGGVRDTVSHIEVRLSPGQRYRACLVDDYTNPRSPTAITCRSFTP